MALGFGLLGLIERVGLAGGALRHYLASDSGYVLSVRLPWPDPARELRARVDSEREPVRVVIVVGGQLVRMVLRLVSTAKADRV